MRVTSAVLALSVCLATSGAARAEFLDGLEQEILTSPAPRLASLIEQISQLPAPATDRAVDDIAFLAVDPAFFADMREAETAALIALSLRAQTVEAALGPDRFLDPREAETAALVALSLASAPPELAALQSDRFAAPPDEVAALILAAFAPPSVETTGAISRTATGPAQALSSDWDGVDLP
ncbi:hypothetical protein [Salinarimonas soli]|uniref:DUF2059 domain-containing protein n=1 Tax=Salinarimonas soli TaxID=1638099 RepID=A0A5B2V8C0_9HYPH|nr:hypothetical protein [Salinarimonas soli]KAA2235221.1 hypothetical protein F0L46_20980 [Salinarimonas soli]